MTVLGMVEANVIRKLAAIFYADVVGYSRLTGADEVGTHRQLSVSLDLMADRIRNAGGQVVHFAGDAVLASFDSVVAATNCAIGVQRVYVSELESVGPRHDMGAPGPSAVQGADPRSPVATHPDHVTVHGAHGL